MQAKQRPAIPHQVKLHVAPATVKLELAFAHAVVGVFTPFNNGQISVGIAFAHRTHKAERGIKIRRVQIVKEQPANAALFVAVFEVKVVVAPLFVFRVYVFAKRQAEIACGRMPVHGILFKAVVGGHVETAPEPPDRIGPRFFRNEKTHVGVAGWHKRVVRVYHQRNAHRLEAAARQFRTMRRCRSGHGLPVNVGKIDARLFKDTAVSQHTATPAAAGLALPVIFLKITAVCSGQFLANLILQLQQEGFYPLCIRFH